MILLQQKMHQWEKPVAFDENFKWPGAKRSITFEAESYNQWMENALPIIRDMIPMKVEVAKTEGQKIGTFIFYRRPFPMVVMGSPHWLMKQREMRAGLEIYRNTSAATAYFSEVVNIPVLADTRMKPWMSLTPNEAFTLRGSIKRSKGNVGIAGLGLGWVARKVEKRSWDGAKRFTVTGIKWKTKNFSVQFTQAKPFDGEHPAHSRLLARLNIDELDLLIFQWL